MAWLFALSPGERRCSKPQKEPLTRPPSADGLVKMPAARHPLHLGEGHDSDYVAATQRAPSFHFRISIFYTCNRQSKIANSIIPAKFP
jgi:hypothetical protein